MIKSFGLFWQNFAVFKGRTRRRDFWLTVLAQLIITTVLTVAANFLGIFKYIGEIYALVCLVPSLAMCTRRLHDTNKSGKRLFFVLLPIIGWIILFVSFVKDGQKVGNEYGFSDKYPDENAQQPQAQEESEPAPIDIPPIYVQQPRVEFTDGGYIAPEHEEIQPDIATPADETTESVKAPSYNAPVTPEPAITSNVYSAAPIQPDIAAPAPASDDMYSGRPSYTQQPQQAAPSQYTQPQQAQNQPQTKPVAPQGYRTRGFPYGH